MDGIKRRFYLDGLADGEAETRARSNGTTAGRTPKFQDYWQGTPDADKSQIDSGTAHSCYMCGYRDGKLKAEGKPPEWDDCY